MKLIQNNPYRIVGLPANASTKDLQSRKSKIQAYIRVGKEIASEYDFDFIPPVKRSEESLNKAFSDIEQNQDKVTYSLFWFINQNPIDDAAIQHLISGNKEKAFEIWEKLADRKEINSKNFSAFNNIATLYLLDGSREKLKQGITAKIKLIESENFKDFVHTVADETFSIDTNKQIEILIDELSAQFKNKFSTAETMDLFSNCTETTQKYLSKKFTEEPIHKIESQVEQTKNKRTKDKSNANRFGVDLHKNTKSELTLLKSILGISNLQYKMLADNVAKEILQCSIDYFNESQELERTNNYLEEAVKLAKLAQTIAVNDATRTRVKDNIHTLEGMKDKELNQAIEIFKTIKNAYQAACAKIDEHVEDLQYHKFGSNRYPKTGVSINWSKVEEMKQNALDWDKVVELIKEAIPKQNIEKIKSTNNQAKTGEYRTLVIFLKTKLGYSHWREVGYLCYWETDSSTSNAHRSVASLDTASSDDPHESATPGNSDNNFTWAYWFLGVIISIIFAQTCN